MQDYIYSVIAFVAMAIHLTINSSQTKMVKMPNLAIHLIINYNQRSGRQTETARAVREYRGFLKCVFAYYITDASWGVLAGLGWTKALYADTVLYFIAISVSVLAWCRFVIVYLDLGRLSARTLSWFGYVLLAMYVALLLANGGIRPNTGERLLAEDTGDTYGRTVIFYPETGDYVIKTVGKPEKVI